MKKAKPIVGEAKLKQAHDLAKDKMMHQQRAASVPNASSGAGGFAGRPPTVATTQYPPNATQVRGVP
jgi:hypothetical protein